MTEKIQLGPNADLIGKPGSANELMTPALIIDKPLFEGNMAAQAERCQALGITLRPHAKSHKCSILSKLQIERGAVGVCCATLREAEVMVKAGVPNVLISSPVIGPHKVRRVVDLNTQAKGLIVVIDNMENAIALSDATASTGKVQSVFIDIDIGMHRTGVATAKDAIDLAQFAEESIHLNYLGVQGYSGMVQHIEKYVDRKTEYGAQLKNLEHVVTALNEAGLNPGIVSGGGTGTFGIDGELGVMTEHQAGSYIFMDVQYNEVQLQPDSNMPYETTLFMMNSVVSNNAQGLATTDGGFKCFSLDGPLPQLVDGVPDGTTFDYFGDEHGRLILPDNNFRMDLGAKVRFITPHCDPTVNLHNYYHVIEGDTLVDIWPIDARGVL